MDAAEALIADIDPALAYPEDFITFRITGYRPDAGSEPHLVPGDAVRGDLGRFVQLLSATLELKSTRHDARAIPLGDVAQQLGVSTKTIQRYRQQGLVCHHVKFEDGQVRLACYEDALQRYITPRREQLSRAGEFSRLGTEREEAIVQSARILHAETRCSLNEAALQLAERFDRAHETVRGILRRHDQRAADPIFREHGPLTERDKRLIDRAVRFGVDVSVVAQRFGRSQETIWRHARSMRIGALEQLSLNWVELPTFALPDAEVVVLSSAILREGLHCGPWPTAALTIVEDARGQRYVLKNEEIDALIAGLHLLTRRAERGIERAGSRPNAHDIDRIETDLRWVAAIRYRLLLAAMPTALRRIEQHLGRALTDRLSEVIRVLLKLSVHEILATMVELDPSRGQNYERRVALQLDRALARIGLPRGAELAGVRHRDSVIIPRLFAPLEPWRAVIGPRHDLRTRLELIANDVERAVIETRWGWSGAPPCTVKETAAIMGLSERAVVTAEMNALRTLRSR